MDIMMLYFEAIWDIAFQENVNERLRDEKEKTLNKVLGRILAYQKEIGNDALVKRAWRVKISQTLAATTIEELQIIASNSRVYYDYDGSIKPVHPGLHCLEEELLLWALAVCEAKLIPEAYARILEILELLNPGSSAEIEFADDANMA